MTSRLAMRLSIFAGAFLLALSCAPAFASDVESDFGSASSLDSSGAPASLDKKGAAKAEAMALFSEACLQAAKNGRLTPQGLELLFKAVELDPDSPELLRDLVAELVRANALKSSLDRLSAMSLSRPESLNLANAVSEVLDAEGKRAEAVKVLRAAMEPRMSGSSSFPEAPSSLLQFASSRLALLQAASGDIDGSLKSMEWALSQPSLGSSLQVLQAAMAVYAMAKEKSSGERPWFGLGLLESPAARCDGKLKDATDKFVKRALASSTPFSLHQYQTAIGMLKAQGRLPDAKAILLNALLSSPSGPEELASLAKVFYDLDDFANSVRAWRAALRSGLKPSPPVYFAFSQALKESGDISASAQVLEWLLLLDPSDKLAATQLALIYLEAGRFDKCLAKLEKSGGYDALYLKALCFSRMKMREQALDALLKSEAAASPEQRKGFEERNYRFLRAGFAEKARRPDVLKASLQPLLDKSPDDAEALNFLGYSLADMNRDLDYSESCVRKALESDPGNAAYLDSLAWVLYRKGAFKEARSWIEKSVAASPSSDAVICDHAGDICAALGDKDAALKFWRAALECPPSEELDPELVKAKIESFKEASPLR